MNTRASIASRNSLAEAGYLAVRVTTVALLKLDPAKIGRASVTAALQSVQNFESDLPGKPRSFGPVNSEHRLSNTGSRIAIVHNGGWTIEPNRFVDDPGIRSN